MDQKTQTRIGPRLRRLRALVRAAQERNATLQPLWAAHLMGETLRSLADAVDELERELGSAEPSRS